MFDFDLPRSSSNNNYPILFADDFRLTSCFGFIRHFADKYQKLCEPLLNKEPPTKENSADSEAQSNKTKEQAKPKRGNYLINISNNMV